MTGKYKNILLRVPNWIGDAVLSLPAIEELKKLFPSSDITIVSNPLTEPIFMGNEGIKERIVYDKSGAGLCGRIEFIKLLKRHRFDIAVLFQNSFESAFLAYLAGIPERVGYARHWRRIFLTKPVEFTPDVKKRHEVFYYLNIINALGGCIPTHTLHGFPDADKPIPKIRVSDDEIRNADGFLKERGVTKDVLLVGVAPGASYGPAKRWRGTHGESIRGTRPKGGSDGSGGSEGFREVVDRLCAEFNATPVIFGGKDDVGISLKLSESLSCKNLNLAGKTSLREFIAITTRMGLFITNDSGPMHIAASLGVPTVAIFGSTEPLITGPIGKSAAVVRKKIECSPCFKRECPYGHYKCMTEVKAEDVYRAAKELLGEQHVERSTKLSARAVFLDRDGTINEDTGYVGNPDDVRLIKGAARAIRRLNDAGLKIFIITNQSGVARGYFSEDDVMATNERVRELLRLEGARIDGIYYCPHHPDDGCACRKPGKGLIQRAASEHLVAIEGSYVVGDKAADIMLAKNIGGKGILVLTGHGGSEEKEVKAIAHIVTDDIEKAADWILEDLQG